MRSFLIAAVFAGCAAAQSGERVHFALRVERGYLTVDEAHSTQPQFDGFAGSKRELHRILIEDLNRILRAQGLLLPGDPGAAITATDWAQSVALWNAQAGRPALEDVVSQRFLPNIEVKLAESTALTFDSGLEFVDTGTGLFTCTLVPPLRVDETAITMEGASLGRPLATASQIKAVLASMEGGLWRGDGIRERLEGLYDESIVLRGFDPITQKGNQAFIVTPSSSASTDPRSIRIQEGFRIAEVDVTGIGPPSRAWAALYLMLPYREFAKERGLHPDGPHSIVYSPPELPLLSRALLERQTSLAPLGLAMSLPKQADNSLTRSVVVASTGTSAADSFVPSPRREAAEGTTPSEGVASGDEHRLPGWLALQFRGTYLPGQGFKFGGDIEAINFGGQSQTLSGSVGTATDNPVGSLNYSRDFLWFPVIPRRISLTLNGNTDAQNQRILGDFKTDERRLTALARAEMEWLPDREGRLLNFSLQVERTSVILKPLDSSAEQHFKLAVLTMGTFFGARSTGLRRDQVFTFRASMRGGVPLTSSYARYARLDLQSLWTTELGRRWEVHVQGYASQASSSTPLPELPSFGGSDSVRGYRRDDSIGRRVWSVQSEFWSPLNLPAAGPFKAFYRGLWAAPFFDFGATGNVRNGLTGVRKGAGLGLRVRMARSLYLKLDEAYGFDTSPGTPRWRFYLGVESSF